MKAYSVEHAEAEAAGLPGRDAVMDAVDLLRQHQQDAVALWLEALWLRREEQEQRQRWVDSVCTCTSQAAHAGYHSCECPALMRYPGALR